MNNVLILRFCWETLGPSPDPNLIKHPWDAQNQDFSLDTGPVGVSFGVWHQGINGQT